MGSLEHLPVATPGQVLQAEDLTIIDLRSPKEFADDHLPGAHNVPLFDDLERTLVGTLYARASPEQAFAAGEKLVLERIEGLVSSVAELARWELPAIDLGQRVKRYTTQGLASMERGLQWSPIAELGARSVLLHCWRGGLRSKSVVALLRGIGMQQALGVQGGYKAYRKLVVQNLEAWQSPRHVVLRGLTGVGKTLVLREIEALRPGWTLDLEGLAGHRSSILGMVGLQPVGQKRFDSLLWQRLDQGFPGACVVEGESRKVGDVIIPKSVWEPLCAGVHLELVAPLEVRVQVLIDDYLREEVNRDRLEEQLPFIEERLGKSKWGGRLVGLLRAGREAQLVELLLEHYYDPLYRHSEKNYSYSARIDTSDVGAAAQEVIAWIEAWDGISPGPA